MDTPYTLVLLVTGALTLLLVRANHVRGMERNSKQAAAPGGGERDDAVMPVGLPDGQRSFEAFRLRYLLVYLLMVMGDWLVYFRAASSHSGFCRCLIDACIQNPCLPHFWILSCIQVKPNQNQIQMNPKPKQ